MQNIVAGWALREHRCTVSECRAVGLLCAFLENSTSYLTALLVSGEQCWLDSWGTTLRSFWRRWVPTGEGVRTLEETTAQFWMPREVGISMHCVVPIRKGKSSRVAKAKCAVPKSWMRLGSSGNWAKCEINETDANNDRTWLWPHTNT